MVAVILDHALVITSSVSTWVAMERSLCTRLCCQNHVSKNMVSLFNTLMDKERRWMANKRASSNVTEAANQVMNIDNATRTYVKGTGGGGIPLLVAHAVDTRCSFFSPPQPHPSEHLGLRL